MLLILILFIPVGYAGISLLSLWGMQVLFDLRLWGMQSLICSNVPVGYAGGYCRPVLYAGVCVVCRLQFNALNLYFMHFKLFSYLGYQFVDECLDLHKGSSYIFADALKYSRVTLFLLRV